MMSSSSSTSSISVSISSVSSSSFLSVSSRSATSSDRLLSFENALMFFWSSNVTGICRGTFVSWHERSGELGVAYVSVGRVCFELGAGDRLAVHSTGR